MEKLATEKRDGMSMVVRQVAQWVSPFIILYALFILAVGNDAPGGAFESGVMLACGFVLLMLASGRRALARILPVRLITVFISLGIIVFWAMAAAGLLFGERFFSNFLAQTKPVGARDPGIITYCELGVTLEVGAALLLILILLSVLRVKGGGTDDEFITEVED